MPHACALLAILAVALAPQEGAGRQGRPPDEPETPEWLGPTPPTREERTAAAELRKDREAREQRAAAASARLAAFEEPLAEAWLKGRPSVARERGLAPLDLRPLDVGSGARQAWRGALRRAEADLAAIDWPNLDATRKLDRDWLAAFLEVELALDALVPERGSPEHALGEVKGVLTGVLAAPELGAGARMAAVTRHLGALPATLESARVALSDPEPAACEHAVLVADDLLLLIQARLTPRLAAARPDPALWEPFDEAQAAAEQALLAFRAWLAEQAQREGTTPVLGAEPWRLAAGALTGADVDVAALKVRLLGDIAALGASLAPVHGEAPPAPEQWHESLVPARVAQRMRETQAAGWNAALDLGLVRGEPPSVGCTVWTAAALPGAPLELHWGERPTLLIVARGAAWSPETAARREQELRADAQRAHALAVGLPGALWELWARRSERTAQRVFWNPVQRQGFALYAADWATRPVIAENPLAGNAALAAEVRRDRLLEAVRLWAAIELHANGARVEEVACAFADFTRLDPASAAFEARLALLDPLRGGGYLGYLELLDAEQVLRQRFSERLAIWWVGRLLNHSPSAPIRASLALFDRFEEAFGAEAPPEAVETPAGAAEEER